MARMGAVRWLMADLRLRVVRLPDDAEEKQATIGGLTDAQAKAAAIDARYWIDPTGKFLVTIVPVTGA